MNIIYFFLGYKKSVCPKCKKQFYMSNTCFSGENTYCSEYCGFRDQNNYIVINNERNNDGKIINDTRQIPKDI